MIFQKRAKKNSNLVFHIGEETTDIVHEYLTCLGTRISSTGNFNVSLEHLQERALHALFGLGKHTDISKLKRSLACKIFDTMISPRLSSIHTVYLAPYLACHLFKYLKTRKKTKNH